MSDSSGSSSFGHKVQLSTSVQNPDFMASSKEDTTGRDWLPKKDAQAAFGAAAVGGERGSAFAKYVRKDLSSSQLRTEDIPAPESKTNSDEPETLAVDSQPSITTFNKISVKQHQSQQQASRPESSGRSDDDAEDGDEDEDSSSSDSDNTHSKGNNGKHSKKRYRSADSDHKPKKQRLIWTPELHARFLAAVNHLGVKNAVPKTILQLMNVEGMTRENVASHLQKYRLYLKRLAGLPPNVPLSADTLQQVQTVQQALQQQVQAGFQTSHTLQLAAGGVPLSLAGIPAVSLAGNYQDLVSQLVAANVGSSAASTSGTGAAAGLTGAELQAGTLAALQRSQLVGAVGVLPGILPIGFTPLSMAGFGGINSAALLGGAAGGIGMVSPVSLANSGLVLQGGNVLAAAQLGNANTSSQQ